MNVFDNRTGTCLDPKRYTLRGLNRFQKESFSAYLYDGEKMVAKVTRKPQRGKFLEVIDIDFNSATYGPEFSSWCNSLSMEECIEILLDNAGWSR